MVFALFAVFFVQLIKMQVSGSKNSTLKKNVQITEHTMDLDKVVSELRTDLKNGLKSQRAADLLKANGYNQLTPPKKTSKLVKFLLQMTGGFSLLLWVGSILCLIVYFIDTIKYTNASKDNLYLGVVLMLVVIITGSFAYYQESKSEAIMDSFKDLIPRKAYVLRDGTIKEIDPKYLVIGDVVEINGGDQVPADILLFECFGCKVDNSSLTGESEPQIRSNECTSKNPMESQNIAFFSTYCTEGKARGIVIRTGDQTVIGQIAYLTTGLENVETSIAREIRHFIHMITGFASTIGFVFFVLSMAIGYSWIDAVTFFIGIIVANVPEGLLATVTVSLTLTAKSMAKKNCLVKNLQAVETLGSTSIICSDKTGTLTQNRMSVAHIWFSNELARIHCQLKDVVKHPDIIRFYAIKNDKFEDFLRVCALCSKTKFKPGQERIPMEKRECAGDASETALFKFVNAIGVNVEQLRAKIPIVAEIPFNSTNKFHLTVHLLREEHVEHKYLVCIKGAPERILALCHSIVLEGESRLLDMDSKAKLANIFEYLASKGERVLAFAEMYTNDVDEMFEDPKRCKVNIAKVSRFTFLGLISLIDPARPEVPNAVDKCRLAGIRIFMVTGDHPITAQAIAEIVGIISKEKEDIIVLTPEVMDRMFNANINKKWPIMGPLDQKAMIVPGDMLSNLSFAQLDYIVSHFPEIVFARTSPEQKLLIVQSCQRTGHIVAATGDGVNDSPALKSANIGIAMGITGSDVSKQAADMILLDDNFASIVVGIEEGRVIFDNLKKSIAYTLASNFAEVMPFLIYVALGFPLALGTSAILFIDLGTDIFPAISLAYEKAELDIMKQKPRDPEVDHLVTRRMFNRAYFQIGMIQASAGFMSYFMVMADHGFYISDLFQLRPVWDDKQSIIIDRFRKVWSYDDRKTLEQICYTAYFGAVVICQWADLLICKTRRNSILQQGMRNSVLNISLVVETLIALFLSYCPGMPTVLHMHPLKWWYWFTAVPFSIFIFMYDETRRMILRLRPQGFYEENTYF